MSYITDHVELFLKVTRKTLQDMFGCECSSSDQITEEKGLMTDKNFHIAILFTGTIQGEYILALDERTAATMLGMANENTSEEELLELRSDFSNALYEALNVAVGETIQKLGEDYKRLTFTSPRINFGSTIYYLIPTAKGVLNSDYGDIEGYFYINLMKLNLATSYHEALENYRKAEALAEESKQTIDRIMTNISIAIFTINRNLIINQGYSAATNHLLDFEPNQDSVNFIDILYDLTKDSNLVEGFVAWVKLVYSNHNLDWQKDFIPLCNCNEIATNDGRILQFSWVPIYSSSQKIDRIMAIAEDITDRRALERLEDEMQMKQKRNLELMCVLMHLEPEEILEYIEETRAIICSSRKLTIFLRNDSAYLEVLFKNLRIISGSASQYNFKELQHTAQAIERELAEIDHSEYKEKDSKIIEKELEGLQCHLNNIENISAQLTDSSRNGEDLTKGIRVPFEKIANLEKKILKVNGNQENRNLVKTLRPLIRNLRQINLFNNVDTLKTMLERLAIRLSKKVLLTYKGDIEIDIDIVRRLIDPIIQVLRNAVVHGIETTEQRKVFNKNPIGIIEMYAEVKGSFATLYIRDDGRGLDTDAIVKKSIMKRLISPEEIHELSTQEKLHLIFHHGFSIHEKADKNVNRGVGLSIVKSRLEEVGGVVDLETTVREGTTFKLSFPVSAQ